MKSLLKIIFFLCLLFSEAARSQNTAGNLIISKRFFSVEDGLASREVFCAIQDNDGFMWFGTRNGLNRYDGKTFKLFTKQKNGLAENKVIQLAKDDHNHLFILYGDPGFARSAIRIEVLDLATYKLSSLKEIFPDIPFDEKRVYWIANGGGDLCFLTLNPFRYWRLTPKGFELKCEMKQWEELPGIYDETWLKASGPFCVFYKNCALLKLSYVAPEYFCGEKTITIIPASNRTLIPSSDGNLINPNKQLADSWSDVYRKLDPATGKEKTTENIFDSYQHEPLAFLYGDFSNALVYRAKDGLFLYDFTSLNKLLGPGELKISSGNGLYSYCIDQQGNIWICTAGGLIRIKLEKNVFTHYFTKQELSDSSDNQVRGIYADEAVYAAAWTKFCYSSDNASGFSKVGSIDLLNILYGVCRSMNKIYVGETEIYLFEPGKDVLKRLTNRNLLQEIWCLDSMAPGKLLAGCTGSIFTYDIGKNELKAVAYSQGNIPQAQFVYRFIKRKDKQVWAVAQNGLYLLDENGDSVVDYFGKAALDKGHQFPFDILLDGYQDYAGIFWFATNGEGLYRWDNTKNARLPDGPEFRQFNTTDGLPSDILYRIESDDYNNLWISTDNGLVRFDTKDFKTRTYTTTNGISHNEFNRISSFKAKDGRLFFGGLDGVNAFYPKDFIGDSTVSDLPIHLISFNKFSAKEDRLLDQTSELLAQNKIVLRPGDRFFNLEFQLLDFAEGKSNYAYMIDGVDKEWIYISENSVRISGLPYGEHVLRVKGQSHNGQWSKTELNIPLVVLKPYYLQWWFIVLAVVLLVFLFISLYKWRVKQLIHAKLHLEKEVQFRTQALEESLSQEQALLKEKDVLLKEIHHRVKNNLQVISGLLELQEKNLTDEGAKQALHEGRTRVRSMALIHQNLYQYENLSRIELHSFINDLYEQVSSMFENKSRDTTAKINIPVTEIDIDTAVPFGLALNELLTNSFKYAHTTGKSLTIEMELTSEKFNGEAGNKYIFVYRDTGPGLPADFDIAKSKSLGMRLINDLSKQMGGSMRYAFDDGSLFRIIFYDKTARKQSD